MAITALQTEEQLRSKGIAPVYVLCGEEESLVSLSLSALRKYNETEDKPGSMAVEFDEVEDPRTVFDELHTQPFLGMKGKRMVVVRCGSELSKAATEQLTQYAKNPASQSVLVLCCDKIDKRKNPARALAQHGVWVDCSKIRWSDARKWARGEAAKHGKKFGQGADYLLVQSVGPNISALKGEIEKLALHAGEKPIIDQSSIEQIVPASRSRTVFELSDAIARPDAKEAVSLGGTLLLYGEAPERIVAFLGYSIRRLWKIARLARQNTSPRRIAKEVGVPDFAVKKSMEAVKNRSDGWFAGRLNILAEADSELKTSSLPSQERPRWLTAIVLKLCS